MVYCHIFRSVREDTQNIYIYFLVVQPQRSGYPIPLDLSGSFINFFAKWLVVRSLKNSYFCVCIFLNPLMSVGWLACFSLLSIRLSFCLSVCPPICLKVYSRVLCMYVLCPKVLLTYSPFYNYLPFSSVHSKTVRNCETDPLFELLTPCEHRKIKLNRPQK